MIILHLLLHLIINNRNTVKDQWGQSIGHFYKPEVIERLTMAVRILRHAQVYAHRADWLLSCDDGEDSFLCRLAEDLEKLQ